MRIADMRTKNHARSPSRISAVPEPPATLFLRSSVESQRELIDVHVAGEIVERRRHDRLAAASLQRVADGAGNVDRVRRIRMDAD
jgi:hypothetical protein